MTPQSLKKIRCSLMTASAMLVLGSFPGAAWAQMNNTSTAQEQDQDQADANIIVTARRREERLQSVPDSIAAFSARTIAERRLERIDDFLAQTSNVRINNDQDTATNNIAIRGLGANRNQAAAVAFVIDGVMVPDADAFTIDLTDVERVEVLKGPQGALYGRGAIAGAINITTRRPGDVWEGEARTSYGTGDAWKVFGAVGGPLVPDLLKARLSASHREGDGTVRNALTGKGLDHIRQTRLASRFILTPSPDLEIDLRSAYTDEVGGALWFARADVTGSSGGEITEAAAATLPAQDAPGATKRKVTDLSMLINYSGGLGTLTSVTAFNDINVFFTEDLDISPFPMVPHTQQSRITKAFSQELRLTSPGERRLRYILGGYYQWSRRSIDTAAVLDLCLFSGSCFSGPGNGFVSAGTLGLPLADNRITFNHYAVFAQFNYDLAEQLELTAALRYDASHGRMDDVYSSFRKSRTFDALQPKLSIAYKPSQALMVYATYSEGFKSGNFNPAAAGPAFPQVLGKETSRNYEFGFKSTLSGGRLLFNGAAFLTRQLNPQIFQLDAATFSQGSLNARRFGIQGLELEVAARPANGLELNASFGYLDAEIKDFNGTSAYVGQQVPNAPKFSLNLGGQYRFPLTDVVKGRVRIDAAVVGRQSFQDFQNPISDQMFLFQNSYGTVDAQLGLEGRNWKAAAFARNLFKRHYATSAFSRFIFAAALVPLGSDAVQPDPGRTLGTELSFRF